MLALACSRSSIPQTALTNRSAAALAGFCSALPDGATSRLEEHLSPAEGGWLRWQRAAGTARGQLPPRSRRSCSGLYLGSSLVQCLCKALSCTRCCRSSSCCQQLVRAPVPPQCCGSFLVNPQDSSTAFSAPSPLTDAGGRRRREAFWCISLGERRTQPV